MSGLREPPPGHFALRSINSRFLETEQKSIKIDRALFCVHKGATEALCPAGGTVLSGERCGAVASAPIELQCAKNAPKLARDQGRSAPAPEMADATPGPKAGLRGCRILYFIFIRVTLFAKSE